MSKGDLSYGEPHNTLLTIETLDGFKTALAMVGLSGTVELMENNNILVQVDTPSGQKAAIAVVDLGETSTNQEYETLKTGDITAGDYLEAEADGTDVRHGEATVWDDVTTVLIGRRLYSNTGRVDYDYDENAVKFQNNGDITDRNDRVVVSLQYPHSAIEDGNIHLHAHFEQPDNQNYEFTVEYRVQKNGALKDTSWTQVIVHTDTDCVFTYPGSGMFDNILKLATVDMTGMGISATVQFRIARTDALTPDILVDFIDAHVEKDMVGSRDPYAK